MSEGIELSMALKRKGTIFYARTFIHIDSELRDNPYIHCHVIATSLGSNEC